MSEPRRLDRNSAVKKPARKASTAASRPAAKKAVPASKPRTGSASAHRAAEQPGAAQTGESPASSLAPLTLFLIRHADAGDSAAWVGDDAARPLSKKGRRQSKRLGELLDDLRVRPDVILTSPRVRAADTAKLVGRAVGARVVVEARLDSGFDPGDLKALVTALPATTKMLVVVGHDPDFSAVASWLTNAPISVPKGALVRIELSERNVGAGRGALRWLLPPDSVKR
jgi:phosphohistidine phosphatase